MTIIDISGVQPDFIPGSWEGVVVKLTEGTAVVNPRADAQWAFARGAERRGFYHYARPALSDGATQARAFAFEALARGFRPGIDVWQLDAEAGLNAVRARAPHLETEMSAIVPSTWRTFNAAFLATARMLLGPAGLWYIGWPFYNQNYGPDLTALEAWPWWLPDYGINDGQVHAYASGTPSQLVVIHQYTSIGGLDRNVVTNRARYAALFNPPPPPIATEEPMLFPSSSWRAPNLFEGVQVDIAHKRIVAQWGVDVIPNVPPNNPNPWIGAFAVPDGFVIVSADRDTYQYLRNHSITATETFELQPPPVGAEPYTFDDPEAAAAFAKLHAPA